jgi:hypothetical protein
MRARPVYVEIDAPEKAAVWQTRVLSNRGHEGAEDVGETPPGPRPERLVRE